MFPTFTWEVGHFFTKKGRLWEMKVGKIEQYDNMILDSSCLKKHLRIMWGVFAWPTGCWEDGLGGGGANWCNDVGSWGINLGYWNYVWFNYGSCHLKVPTLKMMVNMPNIDNRYIYCWDIQALRWRPVFCIFRCWLYILRHSPGHSHGEGYV